MCRWTLLRVGFRSLFDVYKLDLSQSGSMAEGVGDSFAEGWREFRRIDGSPGHDQALFAPDLPPYGGKAVGKGWSLPMIPSAGRILGPSKGVEGRRQ